MDVFEEGKRVLRQEFYSRVYSDVNFSSLKDIDRDGRAELIIHVRFSPDCAGCDAYRIYRFNNDSFELALSLFKVDPGHQAIKNVMVDLAGHDNRILGYLKEKTHTEHPCGSYDECLISDPWLVDTDRDGGPEVLMMVDPNRYDFDLEDQVNYLFIARYSAKGQFLGYNLNAIPHECCAFSDLLGLLETRDKRTHLLVNYTYTGNSIENPILKIFDIYWPHEGKYKRLRVSTRCAAAVDFFAVDPSGYVRVCNHSPVRLCHVTEINKL